MGYQNFKDPGFILTELILVLSWKPIDRFEKFIRVHSSACRENRLTFFFSHNPYTYRHFLILLNLWSCNYVLKVVIL